LKTRIYRELKKINSPKINKPIKRWASEHHQQVLARMWGTKNPLTLLVGM
jgi:hypothetical protein